MTSCKQLEKAIRDLIKECNNHPIDGIGICRNCFYFDFCNRFYSKGNGPWDWQIEDKETN